MDGEKATHSVLEGLKGRSVVLVGIMGAGKTSVGKRLAAGLACRSSTPTRKSKPARR